MMITTEVVVATDDDPETDTMIEHGHRAVGVTAVAIVTLTAENEKALEIETVAAATTPAARRLGLKVAEAVRQRCVEAHIVVAIVS